MPNYPTRQQAHLKALYYLTKSLDDTRLVIDNDGWEHTEVTDLFAIHDYTRSGQEFFQTGMRRREFPSVERETVSRPRSRLQRIAYFSLGIRRHRVDAPEDEDRCRRIRGGTPAWNRPKCRIGPNPVSVRSDRPDPKIRGICYTQLYDVEQEVNGLMTYDRRIKFDPAIIRGINSLLK